MSSPAAVAIADWGTTRLRLWLLDAAGEVVAEKRSDEGLLSAQPDRFAGILERQLDELGVRADVPVMICGMAGSRQGWVEAPYVTVPASLDEIFGGAISIPGSTRDIRIVPGLAQRGIETPDVMRGEETQLAGALSTLAAGRHLVCMPGTHSKWVAVADGVVTRFQTFMTGEMFSVLSAKSILVHSIGEAAPAFTGDRPAFQRACGEALADGGDIASALFRIRAGTLLNSLEPADAAATLSGLLIGSEIASAAKGFSQAAGPVVLIASGAMAELYQKALALGGFQATLVDADEAVRRGLGEAARHHGMLATQTRKLA